MFSFDANAPQGPQGEAPHNKWTFGIAALRVVTLLQIAFGTCS